MKALSKIMHRTLLILFAGAFIFMLLQPYTDTGFIEPISVIILAIALFFLVRFLYRKLVLWDKKRLKILFFVLFAFFVLGQILWVNLAHVGLFGDPWHIQAQATRLMQGNHTWDIWILQYPNLVPLVALEMSFIKLASLLHVSFYAVFYGFNILINSLIWLVVSRILWRKKPVLAVFSIILVLALPVMSNFLLQVGYSDGVAILALVLLVSVFDKAAENGKFTIGQFIGTIILFTFAYLARPNSIVVLVALIIIGLLAYHSREKYIGLWQTSAKMLLACLLGIIFAVLVSHLIAAAVGYDLNNPHAFPVWNWVYESINLKSGGEWTPTDRDYTLYHTGFSSMKEADISGIIQRLKDYNLLIIPLWLIKFATLWSCGTFATGTDYTMFSGTFNWTHGPAFLVQNIGAINIFWQIYSKALLAVLIFAIVYGLWWKKRDLISSYGLILLIIMGISLFHTLLWEVKPRYQFMTIGLLLIAALLNFDGLFADNSFPLANEKWKKRLKIFVPIFSVVSLILMATVMRLQPAQKVVVTAQQHPTDNYGYTHDDLVLQPGETIYQNFSLPIAANQIDWQTGTTGPLLMKIQKNTSGSWSDFDSHTIAMANVPAAEISQKFTTEMPAGEYRFAISNPNSKPTSLEALLDTSTLDYPYLIKLPDGQTASLGFVISQKQTVSKYPVGLIIIFGLIFVIINGLLFWKF